MGEPTSMLTDFIKAQAEFPDIKKDGKAAYGSYATLPSVMAAVRPILNKHNFAVIQKPVSTGTGLQLKTQLKHTSGEKLEAILPLMLTKQDAQGLGSALTYARRYSLTALLGIAPDDDDDGQVAAAAERSKQEQRQAQRPVRAQPKSVSLQQLQLINGYLDKLGVEGESRDKIMSKVRTEAQGADLINQLQGKILERKRQEAEEAEPATQDAYEPQDEPTAQVDAAYKEEVKANLKSLGLSGTGERHYLKETVGTLFTKNLTNEQWAKLATHTTAVLNAEEDLPEEWMVKETQPDAKELAAGEAA